MQAKPEEASADPAPVRTEAHPACPLCGTTGRVVHGSVRDRAHNVPGTWSIRACQQCQIGWLDPQPIDEDIGLCYPGIYYTHEAGALPGSPKLQAQGWKARLRKAMLAGRYGYPIEGTGAAARQLGRMLARIAPLRRRLNYSADNSLPIWSPGGRLLDIGCGAGRYLTLAKSLGWQTFGMDPDPVAAASAARSGATVVVGTLDTVSLPQAPFDAVTSMHSIEHSRDPRRFLQQAVALLRPGGYFYLQTPNFGSLMHRRYASDWYALEISRHLCLLTVPAMRRLLEETGPWASLSVRSIARRAVRELEQTLPMRRTGSFENAVPWSIRNRAGINAWAMLARAGNHAFAWGEEIEVIGIKG